MSDTRILIVEDEAIAAKSLELRLTRLGYTVVGITGFGEEALTLATTQHADLVLMDIHLRGKMDGVQAAEQIRAQLNIPVVFTTAHDDEATLQRAKITDPFGYLVKPFEMRELRTTIEMALYKHHAEQQLRESEQRYRLIAEQTGQLVYDYDLATGAIEWYGLIPALTGYTQEEFNQLGIAGWQDHLHPEDAPQALALLATAQQNGTQYHATYRFRRKDGTYFDVEDTGIFLRDANGMINRMIGAMKDISERRRAELALINERTLLRTVLDHLPDRVAVKDREGRYVLNNPAHLQLLGATRQEETLGKTAFDFFPADQAARFTATEQHLLTTGEPVLDYEELVTHHTTNTPRWHLTSKLPLHDAAGNLIGLVSISRDITDRKHVQDEIAREKVLFEQLFENAPIGIVLLNPQDRVQRINSAFERIFQYTLDELRDKPLNTFIVPASHSHEAARFSQTILRGSPLHQESIRQRRDGTLVPVEVYGVPVKHQNKTLGLYMMYVDITERKHAEAQLQFASSHDALTGIFNRAYFEAELERLRHRGHFPVSIVMVDVDRLKQTNDTLGHAAGDELLRRAAHVLQLAFRTDDIVARIGGDEFAVILPSTDARAAAHALARVRQLLAQNEHTAPIPLSFSLGCATAHRADELTHAMIDADAAMYQDKAAKQTS